MRRTYDAKIMSDFEDFPNNKIIAVDLSADYCAEHESGIRHLRTIFGISPDNGYGLESKKNTRVPQGLFYHEKKTSLLIFDVMLEESDLEDKCKDYVLRLGSKDKIAAAWDSDSFGIHTVLEHKEILKTLYDAFQTKNGLIMLSGKSNPFANSGLIVADYRTIPQKMKDEAIVADKDAREKDALYRKLETESGVYELLKKSGKSFFALSIHSLDDEGKPQWWLNPQGQGQYNYGWYTTEDLKLWAKDKGPIMKKK